MATPQSVAEWMVEEVKRRREVYQEEIVWQIKSTFGEQFTYYNNNGNLAIGKDVLKHFNKLSKDIIVWQRSERMWRLRRPGDEPGRLQNY